MKTISVHARTVLGDAERQMDLAPQTPTADVALSFASAFQLPDNVPWGLRDDQGAFLDDNAPIGSHAVEGKLNTTLTPKAHLG